MWSSRDLALVTLFAVATVVSSYLVGQLGWLLSGIPGSNSALLIFSAIINSVALLAFEGRRWRYFLMKIIVVILILPTYLVGTPFSILPRIPIIIDAFHIDIIFMSIYEIFKKRNQVKLWIVIASVEFYLVNLLLAGIVFSYLFPPEFVTTYINTVLLLLPISIGESIIGALIGYKVYQRIEEVGWVKDQ